MSQTFEFYDARAKASAVEAEASELVQVRERALRAEAAWRGMADRALQIEQDREKANQERAERRASEAEAASAGSAGLA